MPTYDYQCEKCGERFEVFHGMTDATPRTCPKCGSHARRLIGSGGGVLFKGSEFHVDDDAVKTGSVRPGATCGRDTPCCGRGSFCGGSKCES